MMKRWVHALWALGLAGCLAACGGGSDPAPTEPPSEASATLGAAGGTLDGPDGVQLVVPAGALTQDTLIRIARTGIGAPTLPDGYASSTPTYEFTPHGLNFNLPVTIRMPYSVPSSAAQADVFMATPGEDWQAVQASVANGVAEWQRLSFSYTGVLICAIPANNTDPYICTRPFLGVPLSATPATALALNIAHSAAGQSALNAAATLHFTLNYFAPPDCANTRVRILRKNDALGPVMVVLDQAVVLTPLDALSVSGSTVFDVPMSHADNGNVWFGLSFSCTRPGNHSMSAGVAHNITVNIPATAAPAVTQQPSGASVVAPARATFTAAASGAPAPAVQWQTSADGGVSWTDIAGATSASYDTGATTSADNGRQFRAVFDNAIGTVSTQAAVLAVSVAVVAPSVTLQPGSTSVAAGSAANLSMAFGGTAPFSVQMQRNVGDVWTDVGSAGIVNDNNPVSFSTGALSGIAWFRFVTSNPAGSVTTAEVTVSIAVPVATRLALVANSASNSLSTFRVDPSTGALTSAGAPVATGRTPYAVAVTPNGLFAYVSNQMGDSVSAYGIDNATGVLTPLTGRVSNNASGLAMDRLGRYLWVANYGWNTVSGFSIGANGALTPVAGSPMATTSSLPYAITAHPTMDFVYVAFQSTFNHSVVAYSVDPGTGALTPQQTLTNVIASANAVVIDPSGRFLYVDDGGGICSFAINATTGRLSSKGCVSVNGSNFALAIHPTGNYVYVTNTSNNTVTVYAVNLTTGALTQVGTPTGVGSNPEGLAVDAEGTHLYVTDYTSNDVWAFSIGGGGATLTSLGSALPTGSGPQGIALTP